MGKVQIFDFSRTPNTNIRTNILILKTANTNMTFFGYLGSKIPQSFGTQIYLYPIMQVLGYNDYINSWLPTDGPTLLPIELLSQLKIGPKYQNSSLVQDILPIWPEFGF